MRAGLRIAFLTTDLTFLVYWTLSGLRQAGLLPVPAEWMYAGADIPRVVAWNWSFLPIDLAFSATGLLAVAAARRGLPVWRPLALMSLTFTLCAGAMAVGYWTILQEFEPFWFLPNLTLVLWPLIFLPGLVREIAAAPGLSA